MRRWHVLAISLFSLMLWTGPALAKDVEVYVMQPNGTMTAVTFKDVSDVRYEKANDHSGKPDVLVILDETEGTSWLSYEVVGEFHRDRVVGWAEVTHQEKGRTQ